MSPLSQSASEEQGAPQLLRRELRDDHEAHAHQVDQAEVRPVGSGDQGSREWMMALDQTGNTRQDLVDQAAKSFNY